MRIIDSRSGLDVIPREECMHLLANGRIGRLVIAGGGIVDVFPVNYALDGPYIVFRTADGTKWRDGPGAAVAFEIDEIDEDTRSGWSVVVHGRLEALEDSDAAGTLVRPWAEGDKPHILLLVPDTVTGRRIPPH